MFSGTEQDSSLTQSSCPSTSAVSASIATATRWHLSPEYDLLQARALCVVPVRRSGEITFDWWALISRRGTPTGELVLKDHQLSLSFETVLSVWQCFVW